MGIAQAAGLPPTSLSESSRLKLYRNVSSKPFAIRGPVNCWKRAINFLRSSLEPFSPAFGLSSMLEMNAISLLSFGLLDLAFSVALDVTDLLDFHTIIIDIGPIDGDGAEHLCQGLPEAGCCVIAPIDHVR